jgi:hypothetical protein
MLAPCARMLAEKDASSSSSIYWHSNLVSSADWLRMLGMEWEETRPGLQCEDSLQAKKKGACNQSLCRFRVLRSCQEDNLYNTQSQMQQNMFLFCTYRMWPRPVRRKMSPEHTLSRL